MERFQREFARLCGTRSAIAVANGTVALHLALMAMDVRPGDEVIVPALTYVATANAVRYAGAEPVFVDVDPATWCLDGACSRQRSHGARAGSSPCTFTGIPRTWTPSGRWLRSMGCG
ncbi:MAG: aminotransferase class I/II-fold pyridoxal phosphate-dependent enzyme [Bryobacteraceae bacterium]